MLAETPMLADACLADLWRHCADGVTASVDWAQQYQQLLQELTDLATKEAVADAELRARLTELIAAKRQQRAPSRASVIRLRLIDAIAPVRSLLVAVSKLPWQASGEHPVLDALGKLQAQYTACEQPVHRSPTRAPWKPIA